MTAKVAKVFAAIDIGSSKIATCVARDMHDRQGIEILGYAKKQSRGVEKGLVVDIQQTIDDITSTLEDIRRTVPCEIDLSITNINGHHIRSQNVSGSAAARKGEIAERHINQALSMAEAIHVEAGKQIIHMLPQQYRVDNQHGVTQPIGHAGRRLDADVHIVTASQNVEENLVRCLDQCSLRNTRTLASPLAAANSVLSDDVRLLGVCLLDIGHDTTGVAVYVDGQLKFTTVYEWGGRDVTWDIAKMVRTRPEYAQTIKEHHASAVDDHLAEDLVVVRGVDGQAKSEISGSCLTTLIRDNYKPLFELIVQDLQHKDLLVDISSIGFVLTGGGSKIRALRSFAEEMLDRPASVVGPNIRPASQNPDSDSDRYVFAGPDVDYSSLNDPSMSTVVGLLRKGVHGRIRSEVPPRSPRRGVVNQAVRSVYRWMGGNV